MPQTGHFIKIGFVLCRQILLLFRMAWNTLRGLGLKRFRDLQEIGVAWWYMPSTWETGPDQPNLHSPRPARVHGVIPVSKKIKNEGRVGGSCWRLRTDTYSNLL